MLGKHYNALSISRVMQFFQELKMVLLLFAKPAILLVNFSIAPGINGSTYVYYMVAFL